MIQIYKITINKISVDFNYRWQEKKRYEEKIL